MEVKKGKINLTVFYRNRILKRGNYVTTLQAVI